jgi:hypothetical protein
MSSKDNYMVDRDNKLTEYFLDKNRIIPSSHLKNVCKIGQKQKACRYISLCQHGYVCMKKSPVKQILDQRVLDGKMVATGDNCEGLG